MCMYYVTIGSVMLSCRYLLMSIIPIMAYWGYEHGGSEGCLVLGPSKGTYLDPLEGSHRDIGPLKQPATHYSSAEVMQT